MINSVSILRIFDSEISDVTACRCIVKRNEKLLIEYLSFKEICEINNSNGHTSPPHILRYSKY
jgi:hypothetical protein